jgi:hypothetical protein
MAHDTKHWHMTGKVQHDWHRQLSFEKFSRWVEYLKKYKKTVYDYAVWHLSYAWCTPLLSCVAVENHVNFYNIFIGLRRAMCWRSWVMRCAGSTESAVGVSSSLGILRGLPYTSSATNAYRSALKALNAVRIPRRTKGSAYVPCPSFSERWKRSTSPLAAGW